MTTTTGTNGISHEIHVGYEDSTEGGVYESIETFDNVVDVMNLPNGAVKFTHEDGMEIKSGARIIRSRVKGLDDAFRYRCSECQIPSTDVIAAKTRGEATSMHCPVCEKQTEFTRMEIEEL